MASANLKEFTDDNFQAEVLSSPTPVLVDFWAEWCAPCKMLTPTVEKLADKFAGRVKVGKMDIETHREMAAKNGIQSIPTLLVFKGGQVVGRMVGLKSEADLSAWLEKTTA